MRLLVVIGLVTLGIVTTRTEDEAEGEDGVEFEDIHNNIVTCVIESCAGWRLNRLPEVKNFIFQDFESKFDKTTFKKIPGKAPEAIFYNAAGKELERLNIEKLSRDELNKLMVTKGIPKKSGGNSGHDEV